MFNCDNCMYAKFEYNNKYILKNIYCNKVKENIKLSRYRKLKYCLYHSDIDNKKRYE